MRVRGSQGIVLLCVGVLTFFAGLRPTESQSGRDQPLAIESRSIVFTYPLIDPYDRANLYGFNHAPSVATLPDGRLLCVWFSGPFEASVHQVILAAVSPDQGRTWERAYVIQDQPRSSDFDPALIIADKRVWFFYVYGRWNRYPFAVNKKHEEKEYIGKESYHLYARYSDDSGKTWSEERKIHDSSGSRSNGIRLTSGELLLPVHDFIKTDECGVMRSEDRGKTWTRMGKVINQAGADEPTIAELKNGDVLMALRTHDSHLWTCVSKDKAVTWSTPKQHDMLAGGASHNLFRISDGRVVLTHDECRSELRSPLTMRVTHDGETWTKPLVVAEALTPGEGNDYWGCQVTYPSVCELPGKVMVVVWARINMSNVEQYGEIHSARIRVLD
jgi:predicted neuraminidase